MSDKNSTFSSHFFHRPRSNSNSDSFYSSTLLKRRFSATKMLAKAKDSTKSLVHDVLEKRHSLDSKRSIGDTHNNNVPSLDSSASLNSVEKLRMPSSVSHHHDQFIDDSHSDTLSSRKKHYSLPIRRPFTIKKGNNSIDSSLSSFSSSSTKSPTNADESECASEQPPLNAAAAAEADVLSGTGRPGSFATACDLRLANEKKNEEFHALFKSVQENDMLIQDYKCALQKDILLQGHLFISEHHVCFKSNIFGWVTNLVINFEEIIGVEKKMTARIIPNGITISTSTSRHTFASFLSRDLAYDQIVKIWDLRKKINSVIPIPLPIDDDDDNGTEDDDSLYEEGDTEEDEEDISSADSAVVLKTPKAESNKPPSASPSPSPPAASSSNSAAAAAAAAAAADANQTPEKSARLSPTIAKQRPRSVSDSNYKPRSTASAASTTAVTIPEPKVSPLRQQTVMTPTIKKTRVCPCTVNGEQYPHIALNETYKGSVQAMFRLLFDSNFFPGFLERYENFEHVQSSAWKHGKRQVIGQRRIKSSTTGTRVVKTLFEERRIHRKIPYYTCITAKKSMPDMPMGAVYSIQSRTCITRVSKDKVHVLVTFQVVFSKTGLVSSIIEKNAADDQLRLYSHLNSILNKPELIKELVNDQQLLQDLNLANRPNSNSNSSKSRSSTKKYAGQGWISYAMDWVGSTRLIGFVYFGFFLVLVTHCLLALRLKRITNTLDLVQQQKHLTTHTDSQWIDNKMNRVNQHLNQLKEEVQDYHQRIQKLHNVQ